MKSEIGLQFSSIARRVGRAAAFVAVTLALGLMLTIVFGRPVAASTATDPASHGEEETKRETGPWRYLPVSVPV